MIDMKKVLAFCFLVLVGASVASAQITVSKSLEVTGKMMEAKAVYLRAEDVDTFCDISINGHYVGSTSNYFMRWEWDVKPFLK